MHHECLHQPQQAKDGHFQSFLSQTHSACSQLRSSALAGVGESSSLFFGPSFTHCIVQDLPPDDPQPWSQHKPETSLHMLVLSEIASNPLISSPFPYDYPYMTLPCFPNTPKLAILPEHRPHRCLARRLWASDLALCDPLASRMAGSLLSLLQAQRSKKNNALRTRMGM